MFDRPIRKLIDPLLEPPARRLAAWKISANSVTWTGFAFGATAAVLITLQKYEWGLIALAANRVCDGLDGALARQTKPSDLGGFLDIVLDMIFYAGIPLAFAFADRHNLLPAVFLLFSFIGTSGSFLAYAVISAKRGIRTDADGRKSFFYSVGLMEGSETIGFFVVFCLFPNAFPTLAWIFGGLCCVTTVARVMAGIAEFSRPVD